MFRILLLEAVMVAVVLGCTTTQLPRVHSWQICTCAKGETPSLAKVTTSLPGRETYGSYMDTVETILQTQCDIVDPLRCFESESVPDGETVDYIVIGAGTAGSVVAGRLAEDPENSVVLLEAGGPEPTATQIPGTYFSYLKSSIDWNYELEPQEGAFLNSPNGRGYWPRGKVMGGTGVLHGMMYMRGNAWDYDNWANMGLKGWSYKEVLPYFIKSEDNKQIGTYAEVEYHGTGGPLTVEQFHDHPPLGDSIMQAARELGFRALVDLTGHNQTGFTLAQATTRDGARLSLSKAYVHPHLYRGNLRVSQWSLATKILIDPFTLTARGVHYERDGVIKTIYARKEIVVSAGAVASPQLLLLSGVGPRKDLQNLGLPVIKDSPNVGKGLYNHVSFTLRFNINDGTKAHETLNNETVVSFLEDRLGPLTSTAMSQTTGFVRSTVPNPDEPTDIPDIQMFFAGFLANESYSGDPDQEPSTGPVPRFEMTPTLLRPSSSGQLKLRSTDPHDPPIINANYLVDQRDVKILIDGVRVAQALAKTNALKSLGVTQDTTPSKGCEDVEYDTDAYWECSIRRNTNPENHQVGTAAMGKVVDERLRVLGVHKLRVVDASVMPRVPSGNVNAPIVMVAEKGVEMILEDHK